MIVSVWLIDLAVVAGAAVVLPLALGGRWWYWEAAAVSSAVALVLPRGAVAAALTMPWVVVASVETAAAIRVMADRRIASLATGARAVACAYALVAGSALVASRAGFEWRGIVEPIVELAAVHFTYAGAAALVLAVEARAAVPARGFGVCAVVVTAIAPPIVAVGFFSAHWLPQVGGAVAMALGVFATAALELARAFRKSEPRLRRLLLAASGLSVWVPMALAVAWAAGQHWRVPMLSIPDMVRTHGTANALGFVACGLLATRVVHRAGDDLELAA